MRRRRERADLLVAGAQFSQVTVHGIKLVAAVVLDFFISFLDLCFIVSVLIVRNRSNKISGPGDDLRLLDVAFMVRHVIDCPSGLFILIDLIPDTSSFVCLLPVVILRGLFLRPFFINALNPFSAFPAALALDLSFGSSFGSLALGLAPVGVGWAADAVVAFFTTSSARAGWESVIRFIIIFSQPPVPPGDSFARVGGPGA